MSITSIQAALEKRLLLITPAIETAVENKSFTPKTGVPYQRLHHLLNNPVDMDMERSTVQERGIFQVSLFYPLDGGRVPAMTRAQAIRAQFKPLLTLTEGGLRVLIKDTAKIGSGSPDGDRWHVPVSVYWQSFAA